MKPLPKVVCSIDGSTLPVQDYSFTSVANGGYHEFRGQAPVRRLLALGADQEAPLTVYHEETGDILWDGRFVEDPEIDEGVGLISATGPKAELEKAHGRLLFQNRDPSSWSDLSNPPFKDTNSLLVPQKIEIRQSGGGFQVIRGPDAINNTEFNGLGFWSPGASISRVAVKYRSLFTDGTFKIESYSDVGPAFATGTEVFSNSEFTGEQEISGTTDQANHEAVTLQLTRRDAAPSGIGLAWTIIYDIRVNGIAPGDTYYPHQVLQELAGRLGFNTSLIEGSGLNILPLDWVSASWASLADYIVSLLDWRWLISTTPTPGTGLVQYLEAGPWEREWTLFKGSRARPNLKPQQRWNEAVVTYRDVGGSERQVRVRADPDPLAKWGVVRTIEETLTDVQPDATLATAVARIYAQRYSQKRWVGDIDAADARDDSGRGNARLVKPGDIGRLADWGPSEETFHRIHGVEQTQTTVRYSIESPISAAPLTEGAALERARRPSEAVLPELEPPEVIAPEPSGIPSEEEQYRARFLPWPEPFGKAYKKFKKQYRR